MGSSGICLNCPQPWSMGGDEWQASFVVVTITNGKFAEVVVIVRINISVV